MKSIFVIQALALTMLTAFAVPHIDQDEVTLNCRGSNVTVDYKLRGEPAIVTAVFEMNGVGGVWTPIDGASMVNLEGDVNKVVGKAGETLVNGRINWNVRHLPKTHESGVKLRAKLTAWATNAPPEWMVIDLLSAKNVRFYTSTNALPGGFCDDRYKVDKLLMRKVNAAGIETRLGISEVDVVKVGSSAGSVTSRLVGFSRDYYLAIYPTTQGQYSNAYEHAKMDISWGADINRTLSKLQSVEGYLSLKNPVGFSDWTQLRGATAAGADWPTDRNPISTSFLGKLREFSGVDVDLPTESQWEFACRAGTDTAYNDGTYSYAGVTWDGEPKIRNVGTLAPNAWGFFDMPFNVVEICLDHYNSPSDVAYTYALDPEGVTSSKENNERVTRGGWADWPKNIYPLSGYRYRCSENGAWNARYPQIGFRIAAPAVVRAW